MSKPRKLTIAKVSLLGLIEIGPFEIPWPPRLGLRGTILGAATAVALIAIAAAGLYAVVLRAPLADARDAMRMTRYDLALERLSSVPQWLGAWPAVAAMRRKAELGQGFQASRPDWVALERTLKDQRFAFPGDPDLMILEAVTLLRAEKYDRALPLIEAAVKADQDNAEAWFLLGLYRDLEGDAVAASAHYRRATEAAPASPQYRSNLARALLEMGNFEQAIREYRQVTQFPLARVEQALGHWARGEMRAAADAQRDALRMLDDPELMEKFHNRRGWLFRLPDKGVLLSQRDDKRCYVLLGEAASRKLEGERETQFPPGACSDAPLEIRELLADDLCRFVDARQPGMADVAAGLRQSLGQPMVCAAQPAPGARMS